MCDGERLSSAIAVRHNRLSSAIGVRHSLYLESFSFGSQGRISVLADSVSNLKERLSEAACIAKINFG